MDSSKQPVSHHDDGDFDDFTWLYLWLLKRRTFNCYGEYNANRVTRVYAYVSAVCLSVCMSDCQSEDPSLCKVYVCLNVPKYD